MRLNLRSRRWGGALIAAAIVVAGCAGVSIRPGIPVPEVPSGEYEVRVLAALVPTLPADGEVTAAVLYTGPAGPQIEVWATPYQGGLWERSLGKGSGKEHLQVVRSPANYQTVALTDREGRRIGYAALHREVGATLQEMPGKMVLFLSTLRFLDHPRDRDRGLFP